MKIVLQEMAKLFPKLENDLTLRAKLENVSPLPYSPEPPVVSQLFIDLEELFSRMSPLAMSEQEKLIVLMKKVHPRTFAELRQDRFFKRRCETFLELKQCIFEKAEEDWQEKI